MVVAVGSCPLRAALIVINWTRIAAQRWPGRQISGNGPWALLVCAEWRNVELYGTYLQAVQQRAASCGAFCFHSHQLVELQAPDLRDRFRIIHEKASRAA